MRPSAVRKTEPGSRHLWALPSAGCPVSHNPVVGEATAAQQFRGAWTGLLVTAPAASGATERRMTVLLAPSCPGRLPSCRVGASSARGMTGCRRCASPGAQ